MFFIDGTSGVETSSTWSLRSSAVSIGPSKSGAVSTTIASYIPRAVWRIVAMRAAVDLLALLRAERCRHDVQPASVLDDVAAELLGVEVAGRRGEVVQRPLGPIEAEDDADVAELDVEVEQQRAHVSLGEPDRQVDGERRLAGAALRRRDHDHARGLGQLARPAACRLAERERDHVGRLREHQNVAEHGFERLVDEPLAVPDEAEHDRGVRLLAQRSDLSRDG